MGLRALSCFELVCDGCGEILSDGGGETMLGFDSPAGLQLDARADMDWTTDGRGTWHCPRCQELVFDDGSHVVPGQLFLGCESSAEDHR